VPELALAMINISTKCEIYTYYRNMRGNTK